MHQLSVTTSMAANETHYTTQVFGTACNCESTMFNIREPIVHYSTQIVADSHRLQQTRAYGATSASTRVCSSLYRCRPALLIGINAFSKPVHIVTHLSEEAPPLCVSNTSNESSPLLHELLIGTDPLHLIPHYCVYGCINGQDAQTAPTQQQVEPVNTASSSSSVVHEAAATHACTQISTISDEDAGGGINIVTLHNVWRLTATDIGNTHSTDDLTGVQIAKTNVTGMQKPQIKLTERQHPATG